MNPHFKGIVSTGKAFIYSAQLDENHMTLVKPYLSLEINAQLTDSITA